MSDTPQEPLKIPENLKKGPPGTAPPPPSGPARPANAVFGGGTMAQVGHAQAMGKLDEEIPDETIPLPSNGTIYGNDNPLHNAKMIDIRVMTARDEDILTNSALIKKGTVITELLRSCIVDKRINVDDMIAGDRNAVMVALRVTGYGSEYPVEIECSECQFKHKYSFSLKGLPIKTLDIDPVQNGLNLFKFQLPVCGKTVYFKYLTGTDEEEISTVQERMRKQGYQNSNVVTTRLKYSIQQVEDVTDKILIERFVQRMRAGDSLALRKYMDKHEPGITMKETVACPACDHEEGVQVPIGLGFFWPEE